MFLPDGYFPAARPVRAPDLTEFMDTAKLLKRKNMDVCLPYNGVSAQNSRDGGDRGEGYFLHAAAPDGGSFYNDDMRPPPVWIRTRR